MRQPMSGARADTVPGRQVLHVYIVEHLIGAALDIAHTETDSSERRWSLVEAE